MQINELAINKTTRATSVSPLGTVETKVRLVDGLRRYAAGRRLANGRGVALMYRENSANGWIQRWKIGY